MNLALLAVAVAVVIGVVVTRRQRRAARIERLAEAMRGLGMAVGGVGWDMEFVGQAEGRLVFRLDGKLRGVDPVALLGVLDHPLDLRPPKYRWVVENAVDISEHAPGLG